MNEAQCNLLNITVLEHSATCTYQDMTLQKFLDIQFSLLGNFIKSEKLLTVNKPILYGHTVLTLVLVTPAMAVTAGYGVACNNISDKLTGQLRQKLNKDPNLLRGEKIDER